MWLLGRGIRRGQLLGRDGMVLEGDIYFFLASGLLETKIK